MPLWPFRRNKSARKRSRSGAALSDAEAPPPRSTTDGAIARAGSVKKQRTEPKKLERRARTYSFSPDRQEALQVDRAARAERGQDDGGHQETHVAWERMPTLHHSKDGGRKPSRRKSSKRKKRDPDREAEIKAMANFGPTRNATDAPLPGRALKKDSRRVKTTDLATQWENNPVSDVSLPLPGSIHSNMSSDSEFGSFRVSALDSLAPRPTLRFAPGSRWPPPEGSTPTRSASQRKTLAERGPIPEETLHAHKRIYDLADEFDARDIRELMERDNRRRSKQRQREQQKMEAKLSRRAQKQIADKAEASQLGTPPPENLERGVMGRELVGLGIEPPSAVVTSSKIRNSGGSEPMPDVPDTAPDGDSGSANQQPLDTFERLDTTLADPDPSTATQNEDDAQLMALDDTTKVNDTRASTDPEETVSSLPTTSVLAGLLRSKKSRSKSTLDSDRAQTATPLSGRHEDEEKTRKNSDLGNNKAGRFSLSALLRRGGKNRRGSSGPPSFSNTSREEMQTAATALALAQAQAAQGQPQPAAQQQASESMQAQSLAQAQALAQAQTLAKLEGKEVPTSTETSGNYMSKSNYGVPKRTRSRFREDLPDFPISPPASRVQSPEADMPLPALAEQHHETETQGVPIPGARFGTPASGHRSVEAMRATPTSPDPHQSISLASIDSEGSWLSGRVNARRASAVRDSLTHSNRREPLHSSASPTNSTQEDLAIMEDDYLSRLAPQRHSGLGALGRKSGEGRPSSDEEEFLDDDADMKWGTVAEAQPHVVQSHVHDRGTVHSRQGMLNMVSGDDDRSISPDSVPSPAEEKADLGRARSVNLASRGHTRNFSAGSAKLLDLTPRSSVDGKTRVSARRASEPLS